MLIFEVAYEFAKNVISALNNAPTIIYKFEPPAGGGRPLPEGDAPSRTLH